MLTQNREYTLPIKPFAQRVAEMAGLLCKVPDAPEDALDIWADQTIDRHAFRSAFDRRRARREPNVARRLPSAQVMEEMGGNSLAIAAALESGSLTTRTLKKALDAGLDLQRFCLALSEGLDPAAFTLLVDKGLCMKSFSRSVGEGLDAAALSLALSEGLAADEFLAAVEQGLCMETFTQALVDGLDLQSFLQALRTGLNVRVFSNAVDAGMDVALFADTVQSLDIDDVNGALANFVEQESDCQSQPDPFRRHLQFQRLRLVVC